jgi:lysophospholipase L1-like esterase
MPITRMTRIIPLLLTCLALWFPSHAAQAETILCYGDSITFGRFPQAGVDASNNWVALLQKDRPQSKLVNAGKNGRRSDDFAGLDGALKATPQPDRVLVLLGTNDLGKEDCSAAVSENLAKMIATIRKQAPKAEILLLSPTNVALQNLGDWWRTNRGVGEHSPAHVEALEAALRKLAEREKTAFLSLRPVVPPEHLPDGIHPDKDGHRLIAEAIVKSLAASRK